MAAHTARTPGPTSPHHISKCSPRSIAHSTTPLTSPRPVYSVGQNHPPATSPRPHGGRAASPNYFGLVLDPSTESQDFSAPARENWSPASSSIRSFAAAVPKTVPLEPNQEFEAFRRQADRHHGASAPTGPQTSGHAHPPSHPQAKRPRPSRWHSHSTDRPHDPAAFRNALNRIRAEAGTAKNESTDRTGSHDSAYVSMESKRNSDSSLMPPQWQNMPTIASPLPIDEGEQANTSSKYPERDSRLSYFDPKLMPQSGGLPDVARAVTLPAKLVAGEAPMLTVEQLKTIIETTPEDRLMLLDIRSTQSYSQSRIQNALNLCIPTTLLKRATFNIEKLQQTFQSGPDSGKFARWKDMDWIIVYDAHAYEPRDAVTAQNMIKKFTSAGFTKHTGVLRGGFAHFRSSYPKLIDEKSTQQSPGATSRPGLGSVGPGGLAPVIGGVNLPATSNSANPFFSNIRQNMDLADGVGQFDVGRPDNLDDESLPAWLRDAAAVDDHGKRVSQKFLNIELAEQSRMRGAYAAFNPNNVTQHNAQLCGVEKGVKNRYKDILPFEHARVRLENKADGACDYVNASHISASRSHKKYIATQGPLPATFEDFWSVVWDQDVRVIVMLTATSEGGQLKCHPYWEGQEFGSMRLRLLSEKKASLDMDKHRSDSTSSPLSTSTERSRRRAKTTTASEGASSVASNSETPYVIIRKFALSHSAYPFAAMREITHLHFPGWPDFGTPAQPSHLLALVELANLTQRAAMPVETSSISRASSTDNLPIAWYDEPESASNARPMLVHCSAGCGRTGAFCTVDSVIDMLKRKRQAKSTGLREKTDAQGDISMGNTDDGISPFTGAAAPAAAPAPTGPDSYFQTNLHSMVANVSTSLGQADQGGEAGVDTQYINDDGVDLVQKTVEDFRQQRLSMVQSLRQYVLCYETVLEWVNRVQGTGTKGPDGRKRSGSLTVPQA